MEILGIQKQHRKYGVVSLFLPLENTNMLGYTLLERFIFLLIMEKTGVKLRRHIQQIGWVYLSLPPVNI